MADVPKSTPLFHRFPVDPGFFRKNRLSQRILQVVRREFLYRPIQLQGLLDHPIGSILVLLSNSIQFVCFP